MKILVTGAAGFIGMHTSLRLLERGDQVVGIDNLNDYYDPALKAARLEQLKARPCSARNASTAWCTWPRRPACVTPSPTRMPMGRPTSPAS